MSASGAPNVARGSAAATGRPAQPAPAPLDLAQADVGRDAHQPGAHGAAPLEPVDPPPRAQQRLLHGVLRVVRRGQQPVAVQQQPLPQRRDQVGERRLVAGARRVEQRGRSREQSRVDSGRSRAPSSAPAGRRSGCAGRPGTPGRPRGRRRCGRRPAARRRARTSRRRRAAACGSRRHPVGSRASSAKTARTRRSFSVDALRAHPVGHVDGAHAGTATAVRRRDGTASPATRAERPRGPRRSRSPGRTRRGTRPASRSRRTPRRPRP